MKTFYTHNQLNFALMKVTGNTARTLDLLHAVGKSDEAGYFSWEQINEGLYEAGMPARKIVYVLSYLNDAAGRKE